MAGLTVVTVIAKDQLAEEQEDPVPTVAAFLSKCLWQADDDHLRACTPAGCVSGSGSRYI